MDLGATVEHLRDNCPDMVQTKVTVIQHWMYR